MMLPARSSCVVICLAMVAAACGGSPTSDQTTTADSSVPIAVSTTVPVSTTSVPPTTSETVADTTTTSLVQEEAGEPVDLLTFAQGAIPISFAIEGPGSDASSYRIMQIIDGNTTPRIQVSGATAETIVEIVFELPGLTTFDRLAIPQVAEVPSAGTTFFRSVEILGAASVEASYVVLASAELATHESRDEVTELDIQSSEPVKFLKLRLGGGINIEQEFSDFEFSEIIGNGTQVDVELVDGFTGIWDVLLPDIDRSVGLIELSQTGSVVTGCFETIDLVGTVTGNLARLTGIDRNSGIGSSYIFGLTNDGSLQGVSSSNGGPFGFVRSEIAPDGTLTSCSDIPQPEHPLACGSVIYGINFDFNSATLRPDSEPLLQQLFEGLKADLSTSIVVEGHTSTEGSDAYNLDLSQRRAQAVVDDLVVRGIDPTRISALGRGESEPLFSPDDDEATRSMNRRVEIDCG